MTAETIQAIVFYGLTGLATVSCMIVVFARSIVNSAFALFFTLLAVAGFYALLGADFLAVTQVVVYVGGILVLLMFGVLLTSHSPIVLGLATRRTYLLAALMGAIVLAVLMMAIAQAHWVEFGGQAQAEPTVAPLGQLLLTRYLFPFEFASLTLLAALIGAAYLVRRDDK